MRIGTASTIASSIGLRASSAAIFEPSGPRSDQAQKLTVSVNVARSSGKIGEGNFF